MIVKAGDILPVRDALIYMEAVDLASPIEIPPIPKDAYPENITPEKREWLCEKIAKLKQQKNAIVLAHNYMPKDVQDMADFVGDSLALAKYGRDSGADIIVEASVRFMQEILAVMKKPHQKILAPHPGALCSLAAHANAEKIRAWKSEHKNGIVISYVNTYLDVKAESDYCCASANAPMVIKYVLEHSGPNQPILFLPDVYLGYYASEILKQEGYSLDRLWLMLGACHVHDRIRPEHVAEKLRQYPGAAAAIHPECGCVSACMRKMLSGEAPEAMMQIRSTQGMINFVRNTPSNTVIMATEIGNVYPIARAVPEKRVIPASSEAVCAFMKQNTLEAVWHALEYEVFEVTVEPKLAERSRRPIEKMLEII